MSDSAGVLSLLPLDCWLPAAQGPLLPHLHQELARQLAALGAQELLRWAITGVDPQRGLHLEGVALRHGAPPD
ncbi:MAG: hypothetical protein VKI83_10715 [Synechococcaceae cyanobacterium]|nr:hypothetical protein [Synechococcaceae cyanobacterium]